MLSKLNHYGVRGLALEWLKHYLNGRQQYVHCNNTNSEVENISTYGVPQGSVLGPLLFIIYTNDLHKCLKYSDCVQFADDTTIYVTGESLIDSFKCLNNDLITLVEWFKANCLSLNLQKTKYMLFHTKDRSKHTPELIVGNYKIERVNAAKFLGIVLDDKLCWDEHINYCQKKWHVVYMP